MSIVTELANDPRIVVTRPWRALRHMVADPDTFFRQKAEAADGLRTELLLILLGAVIAFASLAYVAQSSISAFSGTTTVGGFGSSGPTVPPNVKIRLWGRAFRGGGEFIFAWLAYTASFVVLTWLVGGRGPVTRVLRVTAWGMVPTLLGYVVYYGALAVAFGTVELRSEIKGGTVGEMTQYLVNAGANEPYVLAANAVLVALMLVSGVFFVYGVRYSRDVSLRHAAWIGFLPAAVHAGLTAWGIYQRTVAFNVG